PLPDLVVSGITAPTKGFAGQDVTVSWTVTNQGAADYAGPLLDVVRLSADASLGGDLYVNALFGTVTIPVGASITRVLAVTLPVAFSGNSRFVVQTDAAGHAFEHAADANNASIDDTDILVEVPPLPNLVVSAVTVPTGGFSSAPVTVAWTVTNTGTGATNAPVWADALYLSTDDTLDAGDVRLGSLANPAYLAAGDSYSSTATVTLPRGISGGYRILVVTDETNTVHEGDAETDNTRSGVIDVTLTPPPDLRVATVSAPTTANSGSPMTVSWTVQNAGTGRTAETSWVDSVYLSADTVLDDADRLLGSFAHDGRLAAGASYAASGTVLLPVGVSGSFHVFVRTDAAGEVYEHTAEDNNTGYRATPVTVNLTPPPDLVVGSVVAPAEALADASIVVAYRVSNDGASSTPENAWLDELFLSSDASFDPATDTLLASQWHYGALEADGGSGATAYDASFSATLPRSIAGAYTLFVVSDRAQRVFELAEARGNNVSAGAPLTVSFLPPDLVAESLVAPASAASGGSVRLGFTVRNHGKGPTSAAAWSDRIVLSSDASYGNSDDLVLATIDHAGSLAADASYAVAERNVQIPLTVPSGDYFLFAVADAADRVFEDVGENDNASTARAISITRLTADLTVTAVGAAPATLAAGSQVTVDWAVTNAGAAATTANGWNDSVWLSADDNLGDANDVLLGVVQRNDPLAAGAGYA
ncbi:MAG: CARDB domain-containing protein, partial [Planctomycetota bacterium]